MDNEVVTNPTVPTIKERNHAIDIERGIAIIFVIFGHMSTTPTQLQNLFVLFNMPFFFIISGKCFSTKNKSFKEFLLSKVRSLLVPYFILGFILYILENLVDIVFNTGYATFSSLISGIPHNIKALVLGYRLTDNYYTMWFVVVLFFVQLIMFFIEKLAKQRWWAYLTSSIVCYIAGWFLIQQVKGFYFSLDLVPLGLAFFSIGCMLKSLRKNNVNYSSKYLLPVSTILALCTIAHNLLYGGGITFYAADGSQPIYTYLGAIIISWFIINVCNNIGQNEVLECCGRNSLVIYAFNNSFAIPFAKQVFKFFTDRTDKLNGEIFAWMFVFAVALLSCLGLAFIYNKCKKKIDQTKIWKKIWRIS